jgi:4-amino-4-deoxychorismate lyase
MPQRNEVPEAGIFETIAAVDGRARLLDRHLMRFFAGCKRLNIAAPDAHTLADRIAQQAAIAGTGVVKLIMRQAMGTNDSGGASWSVAAEPPRLRPAEWVRDGVPVITCRTRLVIDLRFAGLKLLDRPAQRQARSEWLAEGMAEGLMLDSAGRLICGTMTNVFAVIDGAVCTPQIDRCGVAGVMRAALLDAWQAGGQTPVIRDMDPGELQGASEIFLSNALIGVWPVRSLDGRAYPVGEVAAAAAAWVQRIAKAPHAPLPQAILREAIPPISGYDETFVDGKAQNEGPTTYAKRER